jgi:hypothetical protein
VSAMKSNGTRYEPRHDPNAVPRRRDRLIEDVSRELKRRHGGNDVLNRLEAEILVDHCLNHTRDDVTADAIVRLARSR